ncbi:hypothetical protein H6S82_27370 [Planktothrix sp. FACHB-1355]|uniref:Uncharacterized protein n=1 Tax=Aerosakkonema funiforme FACHB-1375 TaxID=2949571 RepID=A0A926VAF1_9CYAN|nr:MULTISPECIES: hypothetical protein [Oscillatoriales]MBD2180161.1 hypothetical protein [Aerosakkonema funiforme FACHB-1375]MBD3562535.1 hypothetical protein [Planktothrix sp. FACHB-1355]
MKTLTTPVSVCKYCQYYKPLGRRGGSCEMLGVSVQGGWKGCHLGIPQFMKKCDIYQNAVENSNLIHKNSQAQVEELSELQIKSYDTADLVVS